MLETLDLLYHCLKKHQTGGPAEPIRESIIACHQRYKLWGPRAVEMGLFAVIIASVGPLNQLSVGIEGKNIGSFWTFRVMFERTLINSHSQLVVQIG